MAGAVGIVFGLCVLSFTLGAALMYVLVRRHEDAATSSSADAPMERTWVEKPVVVEPVGDDYDTRPIHRNPVVGLPRLEPALAALAEPVSKPVVAAEPDPAADREPDPSAERDPDEEPVAEATETEAPETVGAAGYDQDGVSAPPLGDLEAPEPTVAAGTDTPELPPPAEPQPAEQTTWVEREDFRRRYLRTFEEVSRKADTN